MPPDLQSPLASVGRMENRKSETFANEDGWRVEMQDFDCKWNEPVVGGEGEEPVGQNPVVSKTDPRYLRNVIVKALLTVRWCW